MLNQRLSQKIITKAVAATDTADEIITSSNRKT
jgi:hypothetical protein